MLSLSRLAATAAAVIAVAFAPGAALARSVTRCRRAADVIPGHGLAGRALRRPRWQHADDRPDARVVEVPSSGFEWADAAVGGGAALALVLVIAGAAIVVRPRRHAMR